MATRLRRLTAAEQFVRAATGWRGFAIPAGEHIDCPKARELVAAPTMDADWGPLAHQSIGRLDVHRIPPDGVCSGTPMQLGAQSLTRTLWWGGGYGRHEKNRATIPRPVLGRYWITGYPSPWFDRRCIIAAGGDVHEIIQLDQDAPERPAGFPQQALGYGRWRDGVLVEGRTITASDLPGHMYVWGPGSARSPHQQGLVVDDYQGGKDGTLTTGPVCGGWYTLRPGSESHRRMIALGGECEARASALAAYGCRVIDRKVGTVGPPKQPHLLTQAGAWTAGTNLELFKVALADLQRVVA